MTVDTIINVKSKIENAVEEAFRSALNYSHGDFVAFIGFGELIKGTENISNTKYNDSLYKIGELTDFYMDEDRIDLLSSYLNKYYKEDDLLYDDFEKRYRLSVELMIYTHVWESYFSLKSLVRLSQLSIGNGYLWSLDIPDGGKHKFICNYIITPLIQHAVLLGNIVKESFSSDLRNSFAHSMYRINYNDKYIEYWCNDHNPKDCKNRSGSDNSKEKIKQYHLITFEDFQLKFFKSAYLSLCLYNKIVEYQNHLVTQENSHEVVYINNKKAFITAIKENERYSFVLEFAK